MEATLLIIYLHNSHNEVIVNIERYNYMVCPLNYGYWYGPASIYFAKIISLSSVFQTTRMTVFTWYLLDRGLAGFASVADGFL